MNTTYVCMGAGQGVGSVDVIRFYGSAELEQKKILTAPQHGKNSIIIGTGTIYIKSQRYTEITHDPPSF